ncbi:hypothetical protein MOKP106_42730 [Mycobacterium avium subsp. hominissuis]|uniref:hypothetical protein n=1 Tax=Mycobacterium avium TaxID=1764 RepID=UPI0007A09784|nr:hypothetical protein [Mycobacterium avium]
MADVTTIKVTKPVRDRITAAAAERRETVQTFMEYLMDEHDRFKRLAAVAAAMSSVNEDTLRGWRELSEKWSALDADLDGTE